MKRTKFSHEHRVVFLKPGDKSSAKITEALVSLLDDGFDVVSEQVVGDCVVYILRKYHD